MLASVFAFLLGGFTFGGRQSQKAQNVLAPSSAAVDSHVLNSFPVDVAIVKALERHSDPVDALLSLRPWLAAELNEARLLHVAGQDKPQWMTEGDKLRLRRQKKKFLDITDHVDALVNLEPVAGAADKPYMPEFTKQNFVKPLFPHVSTTRMHKNLEHLTGYYNRYYGDTFGELSSIWLHDYISKIIEDSPRHMHISLEYFTHPFPQSSIIARFEPKVRNASLPVTVIGAHQDSANYLFPLLPAPGADDDGSGTVSILEAFQVLAEGGYTPQNGPVEFQWYAAEEAGGLGSLAIARYMHEQRRRVGGMLQFDMTAFIARNATETIRIIETGGSGPLANWTVQLSKEYISLPTKLAQLDGRAGSDHSSFTKFGYAATFATEGDPMAGGFPGDFNPYIHTANDTMDIDDETGRFSLDHMARFAELAIAFAVEQGGWDNKWR